MVLLPIAAIPQSATEPFFDYMPTDHEQLLDSMFFAKWSELPGDDDNKYKCLTETDYREVAAELGVEVAAIKAVVDIETGNKHEGFWKPGKAIINFDLSIYRKFAPRRGVNLVSARKKYPLIFRGPNIKKYGSYQAAQYARFDAALEINRTSAIESCFWGMFQIGGFNWKKCGCSSIDEFFTRVNSSEREQLELFAVFCRENNLIRFIKSKNWAAFSLRYNGPGYKKRGYDSKMAAAYRKYSK